jgi:hypothetical protein
MPAGVFAAHMVLEVHSCWRPVVQCLSFTTTWLTPNVRACSSLYQSLTVPSPSVQVPLGLNARNTSLSLKETLVRGWSLVKG